MEPKIRGGLSRALERSREAFQRTTQRSPRTGTAKTPKGMRIYAVGDIHGCLKSCQELIGRIDDDLKARPVDHYRIVFLGDYIDRGPDSSGVLDFVADRLDRDANAVALRGNHEEAMVDFLEEPVEAAPFWLAYGGRDTMASYGVAPAYPYDEPEVLRASAQALVAAIPERHRRLLEKARLFYRLGDYLFVHAGIDPDRTLDNQTHHDLVWMREPFLSHDGDLGLVVVHGHTPVGSPDVRRNRINVDTGAVFGGSLSAVVLEGTRYGFLTVPARDFDF